MLIMAIFFKILLYTYIEVKLKICYYGGFSKNSLILIIKEGRSFSHLCGEDFHDLTFFEVATSM